MKRAICTLVLVACAGDPVVDRAETALGPEKPGEIPGPYHRAGQPCTTCHRDDGPAPSFAVAGTVLGAGGVTVDLVDHGGARRTVVTNDVGNFFVTSEQWAPQWPITVKLSSGEKTVAMKTAIFREGSCAKCHRDPKGPSSAGAVVAP